MGFIDTLFGSNKTKSQATQLVSSGATNVTEENTSTAREDAKKQRRKAGFASTRLEETTTGKTTLG